MQIARSAAAKGRPLVSTLPFFQTATMKTHGLTIKNRTKALKKRPQLRKFG